MITELVLQKVFKILTSVLQDKYGKNCYSIKSLSIKPGCGTADNYLSAIYDVEFEVKQTNSTVEKYELIFKSEIIADMKPGLDNVEKYFWTAIFNKEAAVYQEIIPRIEEFAGGFSFSPKLHKFYTEGEEYCCLVLDNLRSLGFYSPGQDGLTFDECSVLMKTLGKLHACSLVLEAKLGIPFSKKYEVCEAEMMFSPYLSSVLGKFYQKCYLGIIAAAETDKPQLAERMKKFHKEKGIYYRLCDLVKHGLTSFSCLCHGDPRPANMFFKADAGEMRFVDFQLTRYASPITDLQYAIYLGTRKSFRDKYLGQMLKIYFDEFKNSLDSYPELKHKINPSAMGWTIESLKNEFEANYRYGFLVGITLLSLILSEDKKKRLGLSHGTKEERDKIDENWEQFITGCMMTEDKMRERIYEICDEMTEFNVI